MQTFKNKTVVITGGSKGIGRVLAMKLAAEGANVTITSRDEKQLSKTCSEIKKKTGNDNVMAICGDVSVYDDVKKIIGESISKFGEIHCLINNAAIMTHKTIEEFNIDEWKKVIEVNLFGTFMVSKEVIPYMKKLSETTGATIINIASTSGRRGYERGSAYVASKFAVSGFSECLFKELRQFNIRVITVYPSLVETSIKEENELVEIGKGVHMRAEDVADSIISSLKLPQRAMIKDIEIWCTNP
jgi:3-oxoacyl-[acyl-carrier protein] reductase